MPAASISAAAVAAIRAMPPELVGQLALEHSTDEELVALFARALGSVAPEQEPRAARAAKPRRAKPAPPSGKRASTDDKTEAILDTIRRAGDDGIAPRELATKVPGDVGDLGRRLRKLRSEGRVVATGSTANRRLRVAA